MAWRASSARPALRRDDSSSSLEGLERPLPPPRCSSARPAQEINPTSKYLTVTDQSWSSQPSTPRTPRPESIIDMYFEKPLPQAPGRMNPSPLGSVSNVSYTSSVTSYDSEEDLRGRPRNPRTGSLPAAKEPFFTEWKAPVYDPPKKKKSKRKKALEPSEENGWGILDAYHGGGQSNHHMGEDQGPTYQAEDYLALIGDMPPDSPASIYSYNPFRRSFSAEPEPSPTYPGPPWPGSNDDDLMSPRISDVLDQPTPEFMSFEDSDEEQVPQRYSWDAPGLGGRSTGGTMSPGLHQEKHSLLHTQEDEYADERSYSFDARDEHKFNKDTDATAVPQGDSVHPGMADMQEMSQRGRSPSVKPHREHNIHTPAIGVTPYQMYGSKALEETKGRSRSGSDKDSKPRLGSRSRTDPELAMKADRSMGKKLVLALDKGAKRRLKDERKEELKKKIVISRPELITPMDNI